MTVNPANPATKVFAAGQEVAREAAPAEIARTKEFNSLCPVSAVCMTRNLMTAGEP
jgi:hypothetical protein